MPASTRSSSAKPAASPMLMPLRSASNGRQGSGETSCERVEAEQHAAAQRVDAADHRRVDQAEADQPLGRREHLGARRAGGRDRDARPFEAERLLHEASASECGVWTSGLRLVGREGAVASRRAVGGFGRADARGRGAEDSAMRAGAVALARGVRRRR